jgi:hypothetical protein
MKKYILALLFSPIYLHCTARIKFIGKLETGYLNYRYNYVTVDPGPNWKGYNLDNEENGIDLNIAGGIRYRNRASATVGIGYLNFEGINGVSSFINIDYSLLKTRLSPFINLRGGYSHIWNQYAGGTGTSLFEPGIGFNYRISNRLHVYIQSGLLFTQQSYFIPIRIGIRR